jgi:hypothetical protein
MFSTQYKYLIFCKTFSEGVFRLDVLHMLKNEEEMKVFGAMKHGL